MREGELDRDRGSCCSVAGYASSCLGEAAPNPPETQLSDAFRIPVSSFHVPTPPPLPPGTCGRGAIMKAATVSEVTFAAGKTDKEGEGGEWRLRLRKFSLVAFLRPPKISVA